MTLLADESTRDTVRVYRACQSGFGRMYRETLGAPTESPDSLLVATAIDDPASPEAKRILHDAWAFLFSCSRQIQETMEHVEQQRLRKPIPQLSTGDIDDDENQNEDSRDSHAGRLTASRRS